MDAPIQYTNHPFCMFDDLGVMGGEQERDTLLLIQTPHEIKDFFAGLRVQVGGGFWSCLRWSVATHLSCTLFGP